MEYSFNQGQANEISDMQPFITDGTVYENKNHQETKVPVTTSYGKFVFLGKILRPHKIQKVNRTKLKDTCWQQDKGPTFHHVPISKKAIQDEEP